MVGKVSREPNSTRKKRAPLLVNWRNKNYRYGAVPTFGIFVQRNSGETQNQCVHLVVGTLRRDFSSVSAKFSLDDETRPAGLTVSGMTRKRLPKE
jgi:hypothetical protein